MILGQHGTHYHKDGEECPISLWWPLVDYEESYLLIDDFDTAGSSGNCIARTLNLSRRNFVNEKSNCLSTFSWRGKYIFMCYVWIFNWALSMIILHNSYGYSMHMQSTCKTAEIFVSDLALRVVSQGSAQDNLSCGYILPKVLSFQRFSTFYTVSSGKISLSSGKND